MPCKTLFGVLLLCVSAAVVADSQRPTTVTGLSGTAISTNSIRINWNPAWDNSGVAGYNIYRNNYYFKTVTSTHYIDNQVGPNSFHRYAIVAFDGFQNFTPLSSEITVATGNGSTGNSPPPRNAPTRPTNLWSEIISANIVRVHWDRPASGNTTAYNIYQDNAYVTTVTDENYTTPWVNTGQNYRFHIVAVDSAVNFSNPSEALVVNTVQGHMQNDGSSHPLTAGYQLVFAEEFSNYSLDPGKWNTRYRWGPEWTINNERQYYVDTLNDPGFGVTPFEFNGEQLIINAIRTPDWLMPKTNWRPYISGAINTFNKFSMKYGFVEMRAKLPRGKGLWPAFWLLHQNDYDRRPEIDIMEMLGHQPDLVYQTYHHYNNWNLNSTPSHQAWGPDYSQDYHTYAVKWEPGLIIWYIDGQETSRYQNGNVSWENMYLIVNLAVGGDWPGDADWSTPFPARMAIDYIRAYQK